MNLEDKKYRFFLHLKDGRVDGYWEQPTESKPGGFDATDLDDEQLENAIQKIYRDNNAKPETAYENSARWAWPDGRPDL